MVLENDSDQSSANPEADNANPPSLEVDPKPDRRSPVPESEQPASPQVPEPFSDQIESDLEGVTPPIAQPPPSTDQPPPPSPIPPASQPYRRFETNTPPPASTRTVGLPHTQTESTAEQTSETATVSDDDIPTEPSGTEQISDTDNHQPETSDDPESLETVASVSEPVRPATVRTHLLTKTYGDNNAVDELTIALHPGEVFGLLGPNGAGKTTTILMLLGLVSPTSGKVEVLGLDPSRHPLEVKRRVGYLPDAVGFYPNLTGIENLRFTGRLNRIKSKQIDERIVQLLDDVGLSEAGNKLTGTYSRGMLQRLGIADALIKHPRVLILDEPTTSIDPEGVAEILALMRGLAEDRGVTVLLSSHLLHQVQTVCDRVAIFVEGKVVALGSPAELAQNQSGSERIEVDIDPTFNLDAMAYGHSIIETAEPSHSTGSWTVTIPRGQSASLIAWLVHQGAQPAGVKVLTQSLDEVYRSYFQEKTTQNNETV